MVARASSRRPAAAGFTLIEILVVVGLIALLAGILGAALRSGDSAQALSAAERSASGLFQGARAQAVLLGTRARVIISDDAADPDRRGRTAAVIVEVPGSPGVWRLAGEGITLPRNVWFVTPGFSSAPVRSSTSPGPVMMAFSEPFPFRESPGSDGGGPWLAYEYDARGVCSQPGSRIVLGHGRVTDVGREPEFTAEGVAGFALARFGGVIAASSPEDLR